MLMCLSVAAIAQEPAVEVPAGEDLLPADRAAELYVQRCIGCHTLGGGSMLSGPDLLPSTQWNVADLRLAIQRMEKNVGPMTAEEIDGYIALLKDPKVRERVAAEEKRASLAFEATLEPASAAEGRRLYEGAKALRNGGMACAACHQVNGSGGTMAADLTAAFSRMGETGLRSAIQQANFNVMRAAYRNHPITAQEAAHLTAYLKSVDPSQAPASAGVVVEKHLVSTAALSGAVLFVGMMVVLYRNRRVGTRARLVSQANRS